MLREVLGKCEGDVVRGRANEDEHVQGMADFTSSYHIHGFPFHTPFTSLQDITSRVLATNVSIHSPLKYMHFKVKITFERGKIFNTEEPRAEFSLAVVVHPYPARISSIWVYAVVLIPKNSDRVR